MSEAITKAGTKLANIAFNLSQMGGKVLTEQNASILKEAQREWDAALSQSQQPAPASLPAGEVTDEQIGRVFDDIAHEGGKVVGGIKVAECVRRTVRHFLALRPSAAPAVTEGAAGGQEAFEPEPVSYKDWKRGDVLRLVKPEAEDIARGWTGGLLVRHDDFGGDDAPYCVVASVGPCGRKPFAFFQLEFVSRGGAE